MAITAWTQNHDFSMSDVGEIDLDGAIRLTREFDWQGECRLFDERLYQTDDACPPGVGFTEERGGMLHLFATASSGEWELRIERPREGKFLGIFPKPAKEYTRDVKSLDEAGELLKLFFAGRYGEIRGHMG